MIKWFPSRSIFSGEWADNVLWIELTPKKIANQNIQKTTYVELEDADDLDISQYNFLAPNEIQETINNTWEPMENIISGMSQKIASTAKIINQGIAQYKVDTPLVYMNSENRQVTFLFNLIMNEKANSKEYVVDPVKNLMKWSTPKIPTKIMSQSLQKVELPYVFQVRTKTGVDGYKDIVNMRCAAISSIQPTYFHPYVNGYPCKCELTITFIDIEPISRDKTFNITVS